MIVWLASYPKSGNTLVRSMLAAYFFSKDGIYDFDLIRNIKQFPDNTLFKEMGLNINNDEEIIKNYINVQEKINKKNSIQFLKTHSYLFNINNNPFTDLNNSIGAIYIVRDPRNVVTSWANFTKTSLEKAADVLIKTYQFGGEKNSTNDPETTVFVGTWGQNFNSWKSFKHQQRYLLIKYEDLINNRDIFLHKILKFIHDLNGTELKIDQKKFNNVVETTSFERMKNLESTKGFFEATIDSKTGKKIPFFNLGDKNDWKKFLNVKISDKIERAFKNEMTELGYL